jgi:hypothetical protein
MWSLAALTTLFAVAIAVYRFQYPYGARPCCLPCVLEVLREFAAANNGNFPTGQNPQTALLKLYPNYLADWHLLAGISGNRELLQHEMSTGAEISQSASSWVYWPGFKLDDNPEIAIIWERKAGLRFNGKRGGGHAVGFIGGNNRQVPDDAWNTFLKEQETLRQEALRGRKNK